MRTAGLEKNPSRLHSELQSGRCGGFFVLGEGFRLGCGLPCRPLQIARMRALTAGSKLRRAQPTMTARAGPAGVVRQFARQLTGRFAEHGPGSARNWKRSGVRAAAMTGSGRIQPENGRVASPDQPRRIGYGRDRRQVTEQGRGITGYGFETVRKRTVISGPGQTALPGAA